MRVFVLGTGRTGTTTFTRACEHLSNYTSAHESCARTVGDARFAYPDQHIEADNRLSWMLGELGRRFDGPDTLYVHLRRDPEAVANSFVQVWGTSYRPSMTRAFGHGIIMALKDHEDPAAVCRFMVDTVVSNVEEFLSHRRSNSMTIWLEDIRADFPKVLDRIGARGDIGAAMAEWRIRHNARKPQPRTSIATSSES